MTAGRVDQWITGAPMELDHFLTAGHSISALVGMFSQEAVEKLKKISEAILTATQPSSDADGEPDPRLDELDPKVGPAAGGTTVKLIGFGFSKGTEVTFDGVAAKVTDAKEREMTVITPPHAAGAVTVEVKNAKGAKTSKEDGFTYT